MSTSEEQLETRVFKLEADNAHLKTRLDALLNFIEMPGPGEPGYDALLAEQLATYERMDAEERARNAPPSWTPLRRAEYGLMRTRRNALNRAKGERA